MLFNFFEYDPKSRLYKYVENGIEYKMSLSLMLDLRRHLRANFPITHNEPIKEWVSYLGEKARKEIFISA